ncbi:MAG: site-specific DNA-methyltransferase, partial [Ruthenibacterium sp.]
NRSFYQFGFTETGALTLAMKKQIVSVMNGLVNSALRKVNRLSDVTKNVKSAISGCVLPQSLVKADSRFIVSEKHSASVLFDPEAAGEWLVALEEQEQITDFYIVAKDSSLFNEIKAQVIELLGTICVSEPVKRPMSEGFPANVEYFRLGFLDRNSVSLGQQFREILPLLWLKSGAVGRRPELANENEPDMLILPQNKFAVLVDETKFAEFSKKLAAADKIDTIYFVTNSEDAFRAMTADVKANNTYQLYRDYIDNFVLGSRRES